VRMKVFTAVCVVTSLFHSCALCTMHCKVSARANRAGIMAATTEAECSRKNCCRELLQCLHCVRQLTQACTHSGCVPALSAAWKLLCMSPLPFHNARPTSKHSPHTLWTCAVQEEDPLPYEAAHHLSGLKQMQHLVIWGEWGGALPAVLRANVWVGQPTLSAPACSD
jgi:hypothetical protein